MKRARLEEQYVSEIRTQLQKQLGLGNVMETPKLSKIVLNVGVKEAVSDSKTLKAVMSMLSKIAGQKSVKTLARKSIAGFKLREGMPIGVKVTLRGKSMYDFFDKLIHLSLPKVRDFQGVPFKLDGRGNWNLGIKEWGIFPEVGYDGNDKSQGLNVTVCTTTFNDEHALELLKSFGVPFRKAQG